MKNVEEKNGVKSDLGIISQLEILRSKVPFDAFDVLVSAMMRQRAHLDR